MPVITSISARQVLDCLGRPMVEVDVRTDGGHIGRGAAPTGQSVGIHEAEVLRDGPGGGYGGLAVRTAVEHVRSVIAPALVGADVQDQRALDQRMLELDGTRRKSRLGGNAIYSTSVACLRAAAASAGRPVYEHIARGPLTTLPVPTFNVVNGGRNGDVVQAFNEFILVPRGAQCVEEAIEIGVVVFERLRSVVERFSRTGARVAPSYGYAAPSSDPRAVLSLLRDAADACGMADQVTFALDCASSEMYDPVDDTYELDGRRVCRTELVAFARELTAEFDLLFVEDLLDQDDWDGFALARREIPGTLILGDDLVVTDRSRLDRAVARGAVDGFLLKPNQVGTVSEALATFDRATECGLLAVPSGRSGGVVDDVVMDLSVGLQVPFQKNGAPRSGERVEKLNFLMRVADSRPDLVLADLASLRLRAGAGRADELAQP